MSMNPPVILIEDFITDEENDHMQRMVTERMRPSGGVGVSEEVQLRLLFKPFSNESRR